MKSTPDIDVITEEKPGDQTPIWIYTRKQEATQLLQVLKSRKPFVIGSIALLLAFFYFEKKRVVIKISDFPN